MTQWTDPIVLIRPPAGRVHTNDVRVALSALIERNVDVRTLVCDVSALDEPDLETVDALGRLLLAAREAGMRFAILGAGAAVQHLLELTGLSTTIRAHEPGSVRAVASVEDQVQDSRTPGVHRRHERPTTGRAT